MLGPWPQLLSIFTDYLDCSEALKADVVGINCVTMYGVVLYVILYRLYISLDVYIIYGDMCSVYHGVLYRI